VFTLVANEQGTSSTPFCRIARALEAKHRSGSARHIGRNIAESSAPSTSVPIVG